MPKIKECPKKAMLHERAVVKKYVKGRKYKSRDLSKYPKGMVQARRVIVALQDMLDKSQQRHKKTAYDLYCEKNRTETLITLNRLIRSQEYDLQSQNVKLRNKVKDLETNLNVKSDSINSFVNEIDILSKQLAEMTQERDAALITARSIIRLPE